MKWQAPWAVAMAMVVLSSCGGDDGAATGQGECPVEPLAVVVTVSAWEDIARDLAGDCGDVRAIVRGAVDPHEFEPAPADLAALEDADLVLANGLGYDDWALDSAAAHVEAAASAGKTTGDNPHLWYGPTYVEDVADGVSTVLSQLVPDAAGYFAERNAAWHREMEPYFAEVARLRAAIDGSITFAATESVFEYTADALSLVDITPPGFLRAAASETDPSPADIEELEALIEDGDAALLIANAQTSGSVSDSIVETARDSGVPVVEVTETPPESSSFADWQLAQLAAVAEAVGHS